MNQLEGKVKWVGPTKQFKKGYGVGFKIENFEGYLNIFAQEETTIKEKMKGVIVGNNIRVSFEKTEDEYNSVQNIEVISELQKTLEPKFNSADEITPLDEKIDKHILIMDKIFDGLQSTHIFPFLKDNKELVWFLVKEIYWDVTE